MKYVKVTKSSAKDKNLTIRTAAFSSKFKDGDNYTLYFKNLPPFRAHVSRDGKTLYGNFTSEVQNLVKPEIGNSIMVEILEVHKQLRNA
jgi:hypothetical protein